MHLPPDMSHPQAFESQHHLYTTSTSSCFDLQAHQPPMGDQHEHLTITQEGISLEDIIKQIEETLGEAAVIKMMGSQPT